MKFRAGALEFNATVAEASESPSAQTGALLRSLTIQFRAQKTGMHELALDAAQERQVGGLFSLGDADQPDLEWRIRESTSSYVGSEPWGINHHIWRIEQVERLACTRLVIGSLELEPYDYAEELAPLGEGVIRLAARARITETTMAVLSQLADTQDVVRVGISETPRRMTVTYLWAERPEGLAVVVRCVDDAEPRLSLDRATLREDSFGTLIGVLAAKGVLTDVDLAQLWRARHAARQVANIDSWRL